ncbi:MAG: nuclear transport factor 2 family protein [Acidobacteria bacterium]|nr:nuclear transport factor 2 family protein [Acidobacteriota bacterium]
METLEIGKSLVDLCNQGQFDQAVESHYDDDIVSIEGAGGPSGDQRVEGLDAVRAKGKWWSENHEVHAFEAYGPFTAQGDDRFAVYFSLEVTPKATGQRMAMTEVGLYQVRDGKIVEERFFYNMAG